MAGCRSLDTPQGLRDTAGVVEPGNARRRLAGILSAAFAEGLLSEQTLSHRLGLVLGPRLVDPRLVVGDLSLRTRRDRSWLRLIAAVAGELFRDAVALVRSQHSSSEPLLLALDWSPDQPELIVGRARSCDIVLEDRTVSRRHARLVFRDSTWVMCDLDSTNGTLVNGVRVGRCQLRAGDRVLIGEQAIEID